jgi:hypothetical protein
MAAKQFQQQYGVAPTTTINKTTKLPPIKEDVFSLKQRIQEVNYKLLFTKLSKIKCF